MSKTEEKIPKYTAIPEYNPDIILKTYPLKRAQGEINFHVVQDDELQSGTKQRILIPYLKQNPEKEFLYTSPATGFAQLALAYAAKKTGKKAHIFLSSGLWSSITYSASEMGAEIHQFPGNMKFVRAQMMEYVETHKADQLHVVPFGCQDDDIIESLANIISEAIGDRSRFPNPKRIWLVVGSGVILRALHRVWPNAFYFCIQVGKDIYPDIVEGINHTILKAPENFWEPAQFLPPYPSVACYDAKLWRFFQENAEEGDLIWNVARDPTEEIGPSVKAVLGSEKVDLKRQTVEQLIESHFEGHSLRFFSWLKIKIDENQIEYPFKANFLDPIDLFSNLIALRTE